MYPLKDSENQIITKLAKISSCEMSEDGMAKINSCKNNFSQKLVPAKIWTFKELKMYV